MSVKASNNSTFETAAECLLLPALAVIPFILYRETYLQVAPDGAWNNFIIAALAMLSAFAISVPHIVAGVSGARRSFFAACGAAIFAAGLLSLLINTSNERAVAATIFISAAACVAVAVAFMLARSKADAAPIDLAAPLAAILLGVALPNILAASGLIESRAVSAFLFVPFVFPLFLLISTRDSRDPARPLARIILIFITHSLAISTYFVIFRSFESFRLPQLTAMQITVAFNIFLVFVSMAVKGRLELRKSPFNLPILLVTLATLFSFALSSNFFVSLKEFFQYAFVVMNFLLIIHCLDGRKHFSALIVAFIVILWLEAQLGVRQHFGANRLLGLFGNRDPFSTLGNKNYVAELLAMGIPFIIALSIGARERWKKALCWIALYPMLVVVMLAITRGSWIGVTVSMTALLLFAADGMSGRKAASAAAHVAALALLAVAVAGMSTYNLIWFSGSKHEAESNVFTREILDDCSRRASVFLGSKQYSICVHPSLYKSSFFEKNYVKDWTAGAHKRHGLRIPATGGEQLTPAESVARLEYAAASPELADTKALSSLEAALSSLDSAKPVSYIRFGYGPPDYSYSSRFLSIVDIVADRLGRAPAMWLAFFGGFAAMMAGAWFTLRTRRGKIVALSLLAVLMVSFAAASAARRPAPAPAPAPTAEQTFSAPSAPQVVEDSIVSRSFIWGGAREMIKHHPFGVGIGAFKVQYLSMLTAHLEKSGISTIPGFFKDVNAKEAHCEYLHIWAELGFVGLAFLLFFIFTIIKYFRRIYYPLKDDPFTQNAALGAFSALVSIGASAVFGFPFHIIGTSMFCGAMLALLVFSEDRLRGEGALPQNLPGFKNAPPARENSDSKKSKKNKQKHGAAHTADDAPDLSWKARWAVVKLPPGSAIAGVAALFLFFLLMTKFSVDVQMANILMKQANSYARRSAELATGADAAERRGEIGQAVNLRKNATALDEQALELFDTSLKKDPYNGDIHLFRAMFFHKHKQPDAAMESFLEARRYYDLPQITLDLGALYFEKGEEHYEDAARLFINSMRVYPNYPLPRYNLGLIFYQKAMNLVSPEKASMTDEQAMKETAGMMSMLETLRKRESGASVSRPSSRVEIARALFRESALMFRECVNINPSLDTAAFKLAITFERLYEIEEDNLDKKLEHIENALYWYKYTVQVNSEHVDAYYNYALALTRKAAVFTGRAAAAEAGGNIAEARKLRDSATQLSSESRSMFEKVLKVNPRHTLSLNNLGNMYFNDGRIAESIEMYSRALEADPAYMNARLNIALAHMQTGGYQKTIEYLEEAMRRPMEPAQELKVVYLVGTSYFKLRRNAEAIAILEHTRRKYSQTPYSANHEYFSIVTRYGEALIEAGDNRQARSALEELIGKGASQVPAATVAEAYYLLGVASARSGDPAAARSYLNIVVNNYASTPVRANALNFMRTLK